MLRTIEVLYLYKERRFNVKLFLVTLLLFVQSVSAEEIYQPHPTYQLHQQKEFRPRLDLSIGFVERSTRLPVDERLFAEPKPWLDFGKPKKFIPVPELRFRINEETTFKLRGRGLRLEIKLNAL